MPSHNNNRRVLTGDIFASPEDSSATNLLEHEESPQYVDRTVFEGSDEEEEDDEVNTSQNNNNNNNNNNKEFYDIHKRKSNNPFLDSSADSSYEYSDDSLNNNNNNSNTKTTKGKNNTGSNSSSSKNNSSSDKMDYKGYYSSKLHNNDSRNNNNNNTNPDKKVSYAGIVPPYQAVDRYPLGTSRVGSMIQHGSVRSGMSNMIKDYPGASGAPGASGFAVPTTHLENSDGTNSMFSRSTSSQNLVSDQDFSPFGGFPASSFPLLMDEKEDDDYMHNPDPEEEARLDKQRFYLDFKHMDRRSFGGFAAIVCLLLGAACVFILLPILTYTGVVQHGTAEYYTILSLYQYPQLSAIRTSLVDPDTPSTALSTKAMDGTYWKLAFSDEFNANGRTFHDGDDQFWLAPDIHYQATQDLEWYSPDAVITENGTLKLRLDAYENHDLFYRSGMVQSWNRMCFSQGKIEISANLPNYGQVTGLWPGLWTMGNLGRPGYMGTTDGVWPYSYSSCDAGITPNQSSPDGISYLPGQRLSACTCDGEEHPSPGIGRGAPEIDILEGEVSTNLYEGVGLASQSLQVAPFDIWYIPDYNFVEIYNFSVSSMNTYCGGPFQQAVSAVTTLNTEWYEFGLNAGYYQKFGLEYLNDQDTGYITWFVGDAPTWTLNAKTLHPNGNIGWREISKEPMSIIMNLGISNSWAYINWQSIFFPVTMSIDYVRIYQPNDSISITCDPDDYPTYDYITNHPAAYNNPNMTSWEAAGYDWPSNQLTGGCTSKQCSKGSDGTITCQAA
ncbi:beta-glucan synthesis-associated protein [Hanseniaspora vineae]